MVATPPVRGTFLLITNMWKTLRVCPHKAMGFKLIWDRVSSNTVLFGFSQSPPKIHRHTRVCGRARTCTHTHTHTRTQWERNVFFKHIKPTRQRILNWRVSWGASISFLVLRITWSYSCQLLPGPVRLSLLSSLSSLLHPSPPHRPDLTSSEVEEEHERGGGREMALTSPFTAIHSRSKLTWRPRRKD